MEVKTVRNAFVCFIVNLLLLSVFSFASAEETKTIELRLASLSPSPPAGGVTADAIAWFVNTVEQRTKGKVDFSIYWGGTAAKPGEILESLRGGMIDMALFPAAYYHNQFLLSSVLGEGVKIFAYKDPMALSKAWWTVFKEFPEFEEEHKRQGIKLITAWPVDSSDLASTKPIRSLNDIRKMRIRAPGAVNPRVVKAFGGIPVSMRSSDSYDALAKGVVDASLQSLSMTYREKHYEIIKYFVKWNRGAVMPYTGLVINMDAFNNLPKEISRTLEDVGKECNEVSVQMIYDHCAMVEKLLKEKNIEVIQFSKEEVEKARNDTDILAITDELFVKKLEAKGIDAKRIVERYRSLENEMTEKWARWK